MTIRPPAVAALAALLLAVALASAWGLGVLEIGLLGLVLLLLVVPVLVPVVAFYLWARRRGDLG
jgi:hypothetical protein